MVNLILMITIFLIGYSAGIQHMRKKIIKEQISKADEQWAVEKDDIRRNLYEVVDDDTENEKI